MFIVNPGSRGRKNQFSYGRVNFLDSTTKFFLDEMGLRIRVEFTPATCVQNDQSSIKSRMSRPERISSASIKVIDIRSPRVCPDSSLIRRPK